MGGRGASGNKATKTIIPSSGIKAKTAENLPKLPDSVINAGKITKNAEKIFKKAFFESKDYIKKWGYESNSSFNSLPHDDVISKQSLSGIQTLINKMERQTKSSLQLGVINYEEAEKRTQALTMVQNTLNSQVVLYRKAGFIK